MANDWDHLPNAKHIDRIFQSVKDDPQAWAWAAAWDAVRDAAWEAARVAARDAATDAARYAAIHAAGDALWAAWAAWEAAWDTVMALIAWDDCAYLLDTDPDKVRVLALLGQPAAILLLPAVTVFQKEAV